MRSAMATTYLNEIARSCSGKEIIYCTVTLREEIGKSTYKSCVCCCDINLIIIGFFASNVIPKK